MSTNHELKLDPQWFPAVLNNEKRFEIRTADRDFKVGDILSLKETKHSSAEMLTGSPLIYTGKHCLRYITHIADVGLDGWLVLSIRPLTKAEKELLK